MSTHWSQPWIWLGVMTSTAFIVLGWIGYEAVGHELLLNQLPLCS